MKRPIPKMKRLILRAIILNAGFTACLMLAPFCARGQNAPPNQALTPEQEAAKVQERWTNALNDAISDFKSYNDQDSVDFASRILTSLAQPDGMSPTVIAAAGERVNHQIRQLVRTGALESAATFQNLLYIVGFRTASSGAAGPTTPILKTGGAPGPGGLVLYLPFDKPDQDGLVHDESGAGNDGHVFGAQWVADGKFGGAYQFHITNLTDRIVIPNSDTLNPDHITVSAWIKAADRDGFWNRIADKDYRNGYCLDLGGDFHGKSHRGRLQVETSRGSSESNRVFNDNRWHHVAATFDGQKLCFYIDGVGGGRLVRNPGPLKKNGWDLCIGNSVVDYGTGEFLAFDGLIDEVRIYNRALSPDEVKALATATSAGVDIVPLPAADTSAEPDAAARLKEVKSLYDQGLINKDDYDRKVKEIMDSL